MEPLKHKHGEHCNRYDYGEWLCCVAPDVLWYNVQDVGTYQGSVYGIGRYKAQVLVYEDFYGS